MAVHHVNDDREFIQAEVELGMQNRQLLEAIQQQQQQQQQQPQAVPVQQPHAAAQNIPFALVPG